MNQTMQVSLGLSACLNALFISFGVWFMIKRGGLPYLAMKIPLLQKLGIQSMQGASNFPYYDHRKSQLEFLPIQASDIVFLGDSLTDEGEWAELLNNPAIKNRGISSETTIGILDRLDAILNPQPQKIFLLIGVNDLNHFSGRSPAEVAETYKEILTRMRARSPQTSVLIQSCLPINQSLFTGYVTNIAIQALNEKLQPLAAAFSYPYIDLYAHFIDAADQLDAKYTSDGVHLNGIAYQHWQTLIQPYVQQENL